MSRRPSHLLPLPKAQRARPTCKWLTNHWASSRGPHQQHDWQLLIGLPPLSQLRAQEVRHPSSKAPAEFLRPLQSQALPDKALQLVPKRHPSSRALDKSLLAWGRQACSKALSGCLPFLVSQIMLASSPSLPSHQQTNRPSERTPPQCQVCLIASLCAVCIELLQTVLVWHLPTGTIMHSKSQHSHHKFKVTPAS